jgi:glycosyltransferase involved in cell wall biosynthesis
VDDGSTDATAAIVASVAAGRDWIELIQIPQHEHRDFASKVRSFKKGYDRVRELRYAVIGNLDGDISFDPDYLEFLLTQFTRDQNLGVVGTVFREENGYRSDVDSFEGETHVAGGCQLFRRECFEQVGGYVPNRCGGVDWIAVTTARMLGWRTRSFRDKSFFHHRPLGGGSNKGAFSRAYAYGQKDYYLGGHPVWELVRSVYQMTRKPLIVGGVGLGLGYASMLWRRPARPVSPEFVKFHRAEQMAKLKKIVRSVAKFNRIDPFRIATS